MCCFCGESALAVVRADVYSALEPVLERFLFDVVASVAWHAVVGKGAKKKEQSLC